jgi:hypothetical protein
MSEEFEVPEPPHQAPGARAGKRRKEAQEKGQGSSPSGENSVRVIPVR